MPSSNQYDSLVFLATIEDTFKDYQISNNVVNGTVYENNRIMKLPDSLKITIGNDVHYIERLGIYQNDRAIVKKVFCPMYTLFGIISVRSN